MFKSRSWQGVLLSVLGAGLLMVLGAVLGSWLIEPSLEYIVTVPPAENRPTTTLAYGGKPVLANDAFFRRVEKNFQEQEAQFISVDLDAMELTLYKNGSQVLAMPVQAKGGTGSWWQTPPGLYRIQTKERDHITSFGGLHMPWSMQFHGNFFIHGWPYFNDGRSVTGDTSAGCIRLSQGDARELFSQIKVGTPVLVHDDQVKPQSARRSGRKLVEGVSGSRYLAADLLTNQVFLERGADEKSEVSELIHLMTGLVAAEHYNIESEISARLESGSASYRVYDLLFALLREGSPGAARALAGYHGEEVFRERLNDQAQAIGMVNTSFDSTRISMENTTTPVDLFSLTKHLYSYRAFLLKIASDDPDTSVYGNPRLYPDTPALTKQPEFFGGVVIPPESNGDTAAALGVFSVPFTEETRPVAFIVLDSEDPAADLGRMHQAVGQRFAHRQNEREGMSGKAAAAYSAVEPPLFDSAEAMIMELFRRLW